MFYGRSWIGVTMDDFVNELNSYINWYNTKRIKKSLGYMSKKSRKSTDIALDYQHKIVQEYVRTPTLL